ncbi:protein EMSY-LIKE 3 [Cocos nucifera]|uniref:Protein EMSY-LIKE 3 n=1 Tax=Cocos nucifera TaxID=13894 RepID=A0A8K0II75_COCNU|nr:protein EMSY-LIKE 3 [Cocos nucifera]
MEYLKNDSSGTDDDLPNHQIIRNSRGVLYSGTMRISSGPESHGTDLVNMEFQIHRMETEAYGAVLRAFIAQSDVLSWGKEGLISELRKELRVSDVEHREILGKINSDDSIKSIRELHENADAQVTTINASSFDPNSISQISRKKLKPGHMTVSSSPKYPPHAQPLPTAVPSSLATHAREDHWSDKASVFSPQGDVGQALIPVHQNRQAPSTGKARGSLIVQTSKKGFVHSGVENLKPGSDIIEILATDKLIHEVERVCGVENPDPAQIEKVKIMLRGHERALLEAIGRLADVSDDDSPDHGQHQYPSGEPKRNGRGVHNAVYEQFDRTRSYYTDGYGKDRPGRVGIRSTNLHHDEYDQGC